MLVNCQAAGFLVLQSKGKILIFKTYMTNCENKRKNTSCQNAIKDGIKERAEDFVVSWKPPLMAGDNYTKWL